MSARRLLILAALLALPTIADAQSGIDIKPGDTVNVSTGQGFVLAIVTGREEHVFNVRIINGPAAFKRYPAEVRRRGKPNAYDRANGIYEVGDRVKAFYEGKWIDSRILSGMGMEYQVELPGNLMAWAKPEQIRFVSEAPPPNVAKAGTPPKPGLVSCAGKIEGRYAGDSGFAMQMTFRSGKVTLSVMGETQAGECWWSAGKVYVSILGEEGLMELDINDDGSLQAPFGELKKKGK